ncbi:MAG: FAD binding domain-containing protein [Planktomarina sp.]|nr:FAD binding domain-containing protein [Planktomarina sp.]
MKAPDFDYLRPSTLDEALTMIAEYQGDAMPLAGGQSLMPMMNFRIAAPEALIDLADVVELQGIIQEGDSIRIGAMTRYAQLMSDPVILASIPLFGLALPHIAHDAIRNRGTIGGSLALADPAAEMPALMLVLNATIEITGKTGTRKIKADEFFLGYFDTALEEEELIVAIHIPTPAADHQFGFYELTQRHGDYAIAGVAVAFRTNCYRVAFFGVSDRAIRVPAVENALARGDGMDTVVTHLNDIEFSGDLKASKITRQRLAKVALGRAIEGMTL